jgi:hypothetical protein
MNGTILFWLALATPIVIAGVGFLILYFVKE